MKALACWMAVLLSATPAWGAGAVPAVQQPLPPQEAAAESGMTCYMPYAASGDHLVSGCEVPGYRMQFDLAKQWGMFMVLLPDGTSIDNAPVYFAVDTPATDGQPLQKLFDNDLRGLQASRPGTRIVKRLAHTLPVTGGGKGTGQCVGVSVAYPAQNSHFPYETYFICDTGSKRYALMLSLSALTERDMDAAMPDFLKWMDVPQTVRDYQAPPKPAGAAALPDLR